jgi:hypothetical protein
MRQDRDGTVLDVGRKDPDHSARHPPRAHRQGPPMPLPGMQLPALRRPPRAALGRRRRDAAR